MSQLREFGLLSADISAAAQQLAILSAVYADRREGVESLLVADGEILQWVHQRDTWPPSYALIRSGPARYFLAIEGTTNGWQAALHLAGSFGRFDSDGFSMVNGQWLDVWNEMWATVRPALPDDLSACRVHISGHSYGGAVAQLGGMHLAAVIPPDQVQVMTFGGPRVRTTGYTGPQAGATWRVRSSQDAVGYLPPEGSLISAILPFDSTGWVSRRASWVHYGPDVWLGPAGDVGGTLPAPDPLPEGVSVGYISEHSLTNYRGRLAANYAASGGPDDMRAALLIAAAVLADAPVPHIPDGLPRVARGQDGDLEQIPIWDEDEWLGTTTSARSSSMATVTADNPRIYKVTHFYASGRQGFTESTNWKCTGEGNPINALLKAAKAITDARRKVLSSKVEMDGFRLSDEGVAGDADFNPAGTYGVGPGLASGEAAPLEQGWMFRAQGNLGGARGQYWYRGFPKSLVYAQPESGKFLAVKPEPILTFAAEIKAIMTSQYAADGVTARAVLRTTFQDSNTARVVDVVSMGVSDDGYLTLTTSGSTLGAVKGNKIRIHLTRSACTRGLSGYYRVTREPVVASGNSTYTLNKHPKCGTGNLATATGKAQLVVPDWTTVINFDINRGGKKDVGRPSFLTRGRASARPC